MKIKIAVFVIIFFMASTTLALARGYGYGYGGSYHGGSRYYGHHRGGHDHDGLGIALGVIGGIILVSALVQAANPPPRRVVYDDYPYRRYEPDVVVRQPRVCVENRRVGGEWQRDRSSGNQVWVQFAYPQFKSIQVPCH